MNLLKAVTALFSGGPGGTPSSLTLTNATGLPVAGGGTGATTFTDGGVLIGNAASAVQVTSAGTAGQVLTSNGAGVDPTFQAVAGGYAYLLYQEQQTAGTNGGTFTSGAWRTRALNTEVADTGSHGSVASSQITLAAGTYRCKAWASAWGCHNHATRLYNITDSAEILVGASGRSFLTAGDATQDKSVIAGRFTLAAQKVIELQHQCQTTSATYGLGNASAFGVTNEIFSEVELWKE